MCGRKRPNQLASIAAMIFLTLSVGAKSQCTYGTQSPGSTQAVASTGVPTIFNSGTARFCVAGVTAGVNYIVYDPRSASDWITVWGTSNGTGLLAATTQQSATFTPTGANVWIDFSRNAPCNATNSTINNACIVAIPTITGITGGSVCPGSTITVTGTALSGCTGVNGITFSGGVTATASSVTSTSFNVVVPVGAVTGTISISNSGIPAAILSVVSSQTLNISSATVSGSPSPNVGAIGTVVALTGTGFTGASNVQVNGTSASGVSVTGTSITLTVAAGSTSGNITFTDACGNSINAGYFHVPGLYTWNASNGGDWTVGTNWTPTGPPNNADSVLLIPTSAHITNVPTITLGNLRIAAGGTATPNYCWLEASNSGNLITVTNYCSVPASYTLGLGVSGGRLEFTLNNGSTALFNGWFGLDAGSTVRPFIVSSGATLSIGPNGLLYDPVPSGGDQFTISSGATLKIANTNGIVTTNYTGVTPVAATSSVAIFCDGGVTYSTGANYEYNGTGDQAVGNGLTQNTPANVTISNTAGIVTLGANLTMTGTLTIAPSATLAAGALSHTLRGNMVNNGTFTCNTSTMSFASTTIAQTLSGSSTTTFYNLTLNNTSGTKSLTLSAPAKVSNTLALTSGLLNTDATNILNMLSGSTAPALTSASTSYVNGPMKYSVVANVANVSVNFPIGKSPDCRPMILTVNHSDNSTFHYTGESFNADAQSLFTSYPATVDTISGVHYWTINRTDNAGISQPSNGLNGNQQIRLYFGTNDFVYQGTKVTIVKNTNAAPTSGFDIGGTCSFLTNNATPQAGFITSTSAPATFTSFSTFTLGSLKTGWNSLPIKLLDFSAVLNKNKKVDLKWTTQTEVNNKNFTIERSNDGVNFKELSIHSSKAANGSSMEIPSK